MPSIDAANMNDVESASATQYLAFHGMLFICQSVFSKECAILACMHRILQSLALWEASYEVMVMNLAYLALNIVANDRKHASASRGGAV